MQTAQWRTSSYSAANSNCVEVAVAQQVSVRDTKNREAGQLTVSREAWQGVLGTLQTAPATDPTH
ncbi:DUF397 domain-containing protein [Amycolatopsis sp. FDAARGOS 1241]|uniref:DUF397 domain-containing protein n=1 Tax=Amycolatopsis sp. FDAARGOS 1241 TaxID=2778070 RepID=UPI00195026F3|nr:DUF397 domain-containing protein [Amycolatopsis sp. FDAARGOS 1241]QRP48282.1 DUF397 domain-containing protein [Amycolatopsis sp. FDAARGOS 1241]